VGTWQPCLAMFELIWGGVVGGDQSQHQLASSRLTTQWSWGRYVYACVGGGEGPSPRGYKAGCCCGQSIYNSRAIVGWRGTGLLRLQPFHPAMYLLVALCMAGCGWGGDDASAPLIVV